MRQILGKQDDDAGVCRSFVLNTPLLSRFKNDRNRVQKRLLTITLGEAAARRCGLASVGVCIDSARLFAFRTGIAILDLSWHYEVEGDLPIGCVLEGNYFLSHDNHTSPARMMPGWNGSTQWSCAPSPKSSFRMCPAREPCSTSIGAFCIRW